MVLKMIDRDRAGLQDLFCGNHGLRRKIKSWPEFSHVQHREHPTFAVDKGGNNAVCGNQSMSWSRSSFLAPVPDSLVNAKGSEETLDEEMLDKTPTMKMISSGSDLLSEAGLHQDTGKLYSEFDQSDKEEAGSNFKKSVNSEAQEESSKREYEGEESNEVEERNENDCGFHDKILDSAFGSNREYDTYSGFQYPKSGEHGKQKTKEIKKFPPTLPFLAITCKLPCHAPWVHLRSFKSGGRLLIQRVKVPHREFFRAERRDGRLILHLVKQEEEMANAYVSHTSHSISNYEEETEVIPNGDVHTTDETHEIEETQERNDYKEASESEANSANVKEQVNDNELEMLTFPDVNVVSSTCENSPLPKNLQFPNGSSSSLQQQSSVHSPGPIGLVDTPLGCCSLKPQSFYRMPIPAMRAVLS